MSSITRGGSDYWHDGKVEAPQINNNDAFSLDGLRLIALTGNNGMNGTIYGTDEETYSQITSYGNFGTGPQYFIAWMKDGTIREYGNTTDSRLLYSTTDVMAWKINKISDADGNYMNFIYTMVGSEQRIDEIWYTGNNNLGQAPYNHIKFDYALRDDKNTYYEAGDAYYNKYLLTAIKTYTENNQLVSNYMINYGNDGNHSFLQSISECDANGTCFNPTQFKYGTVNTEYEFVDESGLANNAGNGLETSVGDFNGDGLSDVIQTHTVYDNNVPYTQSYEVKLKHNGTNAFDSYYSYTMSQDGQIVDNIKTGGYNYQVSDFDGDGTDDILIAYRNKIGTTYTELNRIEIITGMNGSVPAAPLVFYPPPSCKRVDFQKQCVYQGDFDGDGRMDFIIIVGNGVLYQAFITCPGKGYINEPVQFTSSDYVGNLQSIPGLIASSPTAASIDFDGDGRNDFFFKLLL